LRQVQFFSLSLPWEGIIAFKPYRSNKKCYYNGMLAKVMSAAVVGLDSIPVETEVDVQSQGLPSFTYSRNGVSNFELKVYL